MKVEVEHSGICVSIVTETNNSPSLLGQVAEKAIKDIIKSGKSEHILNEENNSDEDIEKSDDEDEDEHEDDDDDDEDEDEDDDDDDVGDGASANNHFFPPLLKNRLDAALFAALV